jgi:hypothetical protein
LWAKKKRRQLAGREKTAWAETGAETGAEMGAKTGAGMEKGMEKETRKGTGMERQSKWTLWRRGEPQH